MTLESVATEAQIREVAQLASRIWTEYYTPLIGGEQVAYMVERFQSVAAIAEQCQTGVLYTLVRQDAHAVGYFALKPEPATSTAFLSKIYADANVRGQGVGARMLKACEDYCIQNTLDVLWLTVNRHNAPSIAFYHHMGFVIRTELVQNIGAGFVMDDYRMEKKIHHGVIVRHTQESVA